MPCKGGLLTIWVAMLSSILWNPPLHGPHVGTDVVRHWCSHTQEARTHRHPYRYRPGPISLCRPSMILDYSSNNSVA
eukprot:9550326-Karenia_brevis.AAC.1